MIEILRILHMLPLTIRGYLVIFFRDHIFVQTV